MKKKVETKDKVLTELMAGAYHVKKKSCGTLTQRVPHNVRDQVADFVRRWSGKSEISVGYACVSFTRTLGKPLLVRFYRVRRIEPVPVGFTNWCPMMTFLRKLGAGSKAGTLRLTDGDLERR